MGGRSKGTVGHQFLRPPSAEELDGKWQDASWSHPRRDRSNPHYNTNLRLRRAIGWLGRAEQETGKDPRDADAAFMFLWIAFDALSSQLGGGLRHESHAQRRRYFERMIAFADAKSVIYDAVWSVLRDDIGKILDNRYVFSRFWENHNNPSRSRDWERRFENRKRAVKRALRETRTGDVLIELFQRLNTLRNQLLHGGATWNGRMNRHQVETGAQIMATLVPHFIDVMIRHPDGWGAPRYPVVRETGPQSGWTDSAGSE